MPFYIYVFVRKDLSSSQVTVQAAHACIEVARRMPDVIPTPNLVILGIKNQQKLGKIAQEIEDGGLLVHRFYEPDNREGLTAFATQPIVEDQRKIFRKYMLL